MGAVAAPRDAGRGAVRVMVRADSSQYTDSTDDSDSSDGSDGSDYTVLHVLELGPVVQR